MNQAPRTIEWIGDADGFVRLLDQTLLPTRVEYRDCRTVEEIWEAIRMLRVRGAPAIGIAAAMGVVLGMQSLAKGTSAVERLREVTDYLRTSRPTAVNLFWALDRMARHAAPHLEKLPPDQLRTMLLEEALRIEDEDRQMCRAIGAHGAALIGEGQGVLTHCNAGGLATADYGTALAVMFAAAEQGRKFAVFADETRPLLQGARLTAWELQQRGIDVTLICDNMAAQVMREGRVHLVVTGADRIAANGDTANKIGTYGVALLAQAHGIPFYVAAPSSTFDLSLSSGDAIPIEQRDPREITHGLGKQIAPDGIKVYNPAFDVTPAALIAGIITEKGIIRPVREENIREVLV
ncbi:MAG: S-methyl-5-thioribose-1-phosphate isomerase [Gemmataceae bacterium]|nr:S-methyl-5-thioribose-1-phosphate isomerase [Gemmataceae bacterium]MCI0743593.1 S-methyl-5-thioribose-1-phosphate isomerase [Gemmataceae bacterium]